MASHYKWYPASEEVIVPFNARYSFPSQANKAVKITPRIPPKNGATFTPGQIIRLEFPAQGYVNPLNTTLEFDVTLDGYGTSSSAGEITRFQNNIQSIFNRVRLLYGATPLEDIINYNMVVRMLTEWTSTDQTGTMDQTSIAEGIGGVVLGSDAGGRQGLVNVRQNYIQGYDSSANSTPAAFTAGTGVGAVPNGYNQTGATITGAHYTTRRYQVNLALGLFTQDKLIPTKWMASQLAIEITLEQPTGCIISQAGSASGNTPTYAVGNINLIPEILEFDASYDAMFLKGLREGGVPIKFSSWHTFIFSASGSNVQLLVQERSRSVKALFAVQRRAQPSFNYDSHATFFDTAAYAAGSATGGTNSLINYQFRIGGRYFPAQPVQTSVALGVGIPNGGAEAYVELQKALNVVGDYRLSTSVNTNRWAITPWNSTVNGTHYSETDYLANIESFDVSGHPVGVAVEAASATAGNSFCGNLGSACFGMAIDLETSNGVEISGLNAEEQSDIALIANWAAAQAEYANMNLEVYSYYDAMIILRENNVLELIQ